MEEPNENAVPRYGFKVKLNHEYPEKCSQNYKPSWRIIWKMLPLFWRYFWYYLKYTLSGKSIIMDYIFVQQPKPIYGVPIGGIGSGTIGRGYRGEFCRFQLRPSKCDWNTVEADQFIVTIKDKDQETIFQSLLSTFKRKTLKSWECLLDGRECSYTGLYPRSWTEYDLSVYGIKLICRQISPVIPHDYESSCLPCAVFVWNIQNLSEEPRTVSIAFTFKNGTGDKKLDKKSTCSSKSIEYNNTEGAILYHTIDRMQCSYTLAVKNNFTSVSKCLYFDPNGNGATVWNQLRTKGEFDKISEKTDTHVFGEMAVGVAGKVTIPGTQRGDIEMALVWDMPVISYPVSQKKYYRYYTEKFGKENAAVKIADFALNNYDKWNKQIHKWQLKVLDDVDLPDWYKSALFNESYFISDGGSAWLSMDGNTENLSKNDPRRKYGRFALIEGLEYRMYNSYDVHFYASHALSYNWPSLQKCIQYDLRDFISMELPEKAEMLYDGDVVKRKKAGYIPHDAGDPGESPFELINAYNIHDVSGWRDLNQKFVLQTLRDSIGDIGYDVDYLSDMYDVCDKLMMKMLQYDVDNDGVIENSGRPDQTYDAWVMTGTSAYCGGLWLAAVYSMIRMAQVLRNPNDIKKYEDLLDRGKESFDKKLWNGKYYNFDCSTDHSDVIMSDQLDGHWYLSCIGFGRIYPVYPEDKVRSALQSIYENNVLCFCEGKKGAVNGFKNGNVDGATLQSLETWTGVTYALAATMIFEGMVKEGFHTAGGMFKTMTEKNGLIFNTPEALYSSNQVRSIAYMRPLSIWSMQIAWESLKRSRESEQ